MNTEELIFRRFQQIADSPLLPAEVAPEDYEAREVLAWLSQVQSGPILDAGCGKGRFTQLISKAGRAAIGLEPVELFLHRARAQNPQARWVQGSLTALPLDGKSCAGTICIGVLQHIPDTTRAVSELSRVTRAGGKLLLIDKNLIGIGYHRVFPNWLYKPTAEWRNQWMYPRDFPFREKWFIPWHLRRLITTHYSACKIRYLTGRVRGRSRRLLLPLFRFFPWLSPDIALWAVR